MVTQSRQINYENIKLSIQVSLNGLSFCALSKEEKRIVFFRDILFSRKLNPAQVLQQIEKQYEQEPFLSSGNPEVIVLFSNELYSLVPTEFFEEENASEYLKYNTKILETDYVAKDDIVSAEIVNVYIPYTNINNFFFDRYGEFEYRHSVSVLAEEFQIQNRFQKEGTRVYLNCFPGGYDLLVYQQGKLILANSFNCNSREDFIYYLLFCAEQLDLDPSSFELILLGRIREKSDYYEIAYTYVKEIKFLQSSFGYIFNGKEEPPKGYMHYTLFKALE
ncbi:DUF3822 family protein [Salinimicrobium sp. MT39]|uniref:DUF3822 family protein n=1 Tax=Salinimicrobium profundisediminis TaxID=2994553 RepID=A0A9X3CZB8_9FLAO|nr:DUF3822 family protein [Salinimicrobium profundisediminis]MCX2839292.1 DUF3822 family protein [Salinimicrobium profundisediminis]